MSFPQLKINVKGNKRSVENEHTPNQIASSKLQGQKQKCSRYNYNLKYDKEHEVHNTLHNISSSDPSTKTLLKKVNGKPFKPRFPTPPLTGTKCSDNLKGHKILNKSSSPPPLPAPCAFISSDSVNMENTLVEDEDTVCIKTKTLKNEKSKQQLRPIKSLTYKSRDLGKSAKSFKISSQDSLQNEVIPVRQRNNGISLPYDNEFCCDDDKFHLIEKDCFKEELVSTF